MCVAVVRANYTAVLKNMLADYEETFADISDLIYTNTYKFYSGTRCALKEIALACMRAA